MLICVLLLLNSCMLLDTSGSGVPSADQTETEKSGGDTYNITAGDNYNVNISSNAQLNVLAASKSVLSVVSIVCEFDRRSPQQGAGVIYQLDKEKGNAYIITNYHVVYNAYSSQDNRISNSISLYLYGQEATKYAIPATYIGGSMNYDLAVLKVENSSVLMQSSAAAAAVADSDEVSILETAIAVGNPEGIGLSATVGCVNVDSEYIEISMILKNGYSKYFELRCIRIDAAVNGGNSGGGLFNDKGELIGIVNAKLAEDNVDNIGYAIPSNVAVAVAENIIDYCDGTAYESVRRCIIGVKVGATASGVNYDTETGKIRKWEKVVITEVTSGGAADGILFAGDVVNSITIDGIKHDVTRRHHVIDSMLNARVGSSVSINITRDGTARDVIIEIKNTMLEDY